jgi:putative chitinase
MILTQEKLQLILPKIKDINQWFIPLSELLPAHDINTKSRISTFLAQCIHESNGFKVLEENLNYRATGLRKVFKKYFPTDEFALLYEHKPEMIANRVYANRMGNGPETSGDGYKYHGRGIIQLTGKNNYLLLSLDIQMPIDDLPMYLITPYGAIHSACWFWNKNKLNKYADENDMITITKKINGGFNGLEDRIKHYNHILTIL